MRTSFDIVVAGSGAAGIASAVCAARAGCDTLLLSSDASPGGTGGFSGLTTICGLFDHAGKFINEGFSREFAAAVTDALPIRMGKVWVLPYRPESFRRAAANLLSSTPNLTTSWNTPISHASIKHGRIASINGIDVGAVIDCTGTAEIARAVGAECLFTDETTQASAVIFPLLNVTRELKSSADIAQVLLPLARAGLPPLSFQLGQDPGTVFVKFTGRPDQVESVIEVLRAQVTGFESCYSSPGQFISAQRAGRMIVGKYVLSGEDVLAGQKFDDAVARCAWPIEQWDISGQNRLRYPANGTSYEIPARSLQAAHLDNLFMAGKAISADVDAIASARVMGCCLATGAAAGNLAARALASAHAT